MMENKKDLENEVLEEVTAGALGTATLPTHSNFCPRCRSAKHHTLRKEGSLELRKCDVCQFEYYYRKW